jgi:flavin reductase (DIM6/NTAB) family NADH-FMN oxidoreductase RutF
MAEKILPLDAATKQAIGEALGRIPAALYVLTAAHEDRRGGILCSWVHQVCFEPPMISVAIMKGRSVMPLISESRQFALCQLGENDRLVQRKFSHAHDSAEDPFLAFETLPSKLPGVPILHTSVGYLECELVCHMDVEGDHDLFVARVANARSFGAKPIIRERGDGFAY